MLVDENFKGKVCRLCQLRQEGVTTKKHGQGMGLYNVHKLVSAVEGRIEFETGNLGTTVTVQIPCKNKGSAIS